MIAAIAPNGRLYVAGQDQAFTSEDIVWFLTKLWGRYRKGCMLIIWDGAPIHRREMVKTFLKERLGRVHLKRLPAYSPHRTAAAAQPRRTHVKPIETESENQQGRLAVFTNLKTLKTAILDQVKILEKDPEMVE